MKKFICFVLALCFIVSLNSVENNNASPELSSISDSSIKINQLAMLDDLIEVTKDNLEQEKQLRQLVQEYLDIQTAYLKSPDSKELTIRMVKSAYRVLEKIKETNLLQAFDTEFISELNFFSQIAVKRGVPSPK